MVSGALRKIPRRASRRGAAEPAAPCGRFSQERREIGAFAFTPHAVGAKELLRVENVCLPASTGSGRRSTCT